MTWSPDKEILIRVLEALKETNKIMTQMEYFEYSLPLQTRGYLNSILIKEIDLYLRKNVESYKDYGIEPE